LNQNKNRNTIACKNVGKYPSKILGTPKSGAPGLSLFSLMVNPHLPQDQTWGRQTCILTQRHLTSLRPWATGKFISFQRKPDT